MERFVKCGNVTCERHGVVARVPALRVARGVVAVPPLFCEDCGHAMPDVEAAVEAAPENAMRPRARRR